MTRIADFMAGRSTAEVYEARLAPGVFAPWAERLTTEAPEGAACLDIACGTGVVARAIARRDPSGAEIAGTDVAEPMIAEATRLAAAEGLADRIAYHAAPADALPYDDDAFDAAFIQQGLQFFPDKPAALAEARRVLKPGGRLVAAVWTAVDGAPVYAAWEAAVADRLGADLTPLKPFSLGDADALRTLVEDAGFAVRSLERESLMTRLPDLETLPLFDIRFLARPDADGTLTPIVDPDDPASDAVVAGLIEAFAARLGDHLRADGTLVAPMAAHVVTAEA
ncbi:hypothetical protein DDZ18_10905 [Marinicauda salina]|uniref:Methyltransferase type 11 domain-containing protein n=1 Tax=Marinicauda salina TaxID=2135793 RepID=A0A2U2BRR8_9PROT|nr:class I SAM-dependent methyltransferase [Marinicauda salina]PWE16711.1 hypothetical protein DDZ18_10905 [Marinicauda salina]